MILPYCLFFGLDNDYLEDFEPKGQGSSYRSYSDFFQRQYKSFPLADGKYIWPCEGYVCDWGTFRDKQGSLVKGQRIDLNSIFASDPGATLDHFFVNVFLHNHNYHRIHAPVSGKVIRIEHIPGDLVFLRPWFYDRKETSYPAFRNERVIIEMQDSSNKSWHVAMVGGFGVGTINVNPSITLGARVEIGQELGLFKLGSTVCIASPRPIVVQDYLEMVRAGQAMKVDVPIASANLHFQLADSEFIEDTSNELFS